MKKIFVIASTALLALAGCKNSNTTVETTAAAEGADAAETRALSNLVAYIRIDSLMSGYDMYKDLTAEFQKRATAVDKDLSSRGNSLQKAYADANDKMNKGLLTRAEAEKLQADLAKREESLYSFRDAKQRELAEEEAVMTNKIFHSINDFVAEFNKNYHYAMILTTAGGSPILHADPRMDITQTVLKGLNEKYAEERKAEK